MLDVGADLVVTDRPMMAHVSVIGKHKDRDVFGNLQQLSLHIIVRPVTKSNQLTNITNC